MPSRLRSFGGALLPAGKKFSLLDRQARPAERGDVLQWVIFERYEARLGAFPECADGALGEEQAGEPLSRLAGTVSR